MCHIITASAHLLHNATNDEYTVFLSSNDALALATVADKLNAMDAETVIGVLLCHFTKGYVKLEDMSCGGLVQMFVSTGPRERRRRNHIRSEGWWQPKERSPSPHYRPWSFCLQWHRLHHWPCHASKLRRWLWVTPRMAPSRIISEQGSRSVVLVLLCWQSIYKRNHEARWHETRRK